MAARPAIAAACAVLAAVAALGWWLYGGGHAALAPRLSVSQQQADPELLASRFVYDIVLHDAAQIRELLARIEQLAGTVAVNAGDPGIALVLHGPEIRFFARAGGERYRDIVERAAALDARGILEVKVCRTRLRELGLAAQDMPPFAELVPFGPDEIDRLQRRGYVLM